MEPVYRKRKTGFVLYLVKELKINFEKNRAG